MKHHKHSPDWRKNRRKMLRHKSGCRKFGKLYANRCNRRHSKKILQLVDCDSDEVSRVLGYIGDKMKRHHLVIIGW